MLGHSLGGEVIFFNRLQHFIATALDFMPCLLARAKRDCNKGFVWETGESSDTHVMEQIIKSVIQIKRMNNIQRIIAIFLWLESNYSPIGIWICTMFRAGPSSSTNFIDSWILGNDKHMSIRRVCNELSFLKRNYPCARKNYYKIILAQCAKQIWPHWNQPWWLGGRAVVW